MNGVRPLQPPSQTREDLLRAFEEDAPVYGIVRTGLIEIEGDAIGVGRVTVLPCPRRVGKCLDPSKRANGELPREEECRNRLSLRSKSRLTDGPPPSSTAADGADAHSVQGRRGSSSGHGNTRCVNMHGIDARGRPWGASGKWPAAPAIHGASTAGA